MADEPDIKTSREEFAEARRALVDKYVAEHPGLSHHDFNDIKVSEFGTHAATLAADRVNADREAGARALGISLEEFDALKAKPAAGESTPQQRAANLPSGRSAPPPTQGSMNERDREGGAWGIDLIEQAARDDYAHLFRNG